jgi:predicted ATPase
LLADGLGITAEERNQLLALAELRRKARALPTRGASPSPTSLASPNNLPFQISTFIGRERELDDLNKLIAGCRLLTIVGPGGIGKTRLALQLAANVLERYADGVWFVDLTAVRDPDFIPQMIATELNVRELPSERIEETSIAHINGKKLLLFIDNSEHLLAGVAKIVKAVLSQCPAMTVMTTSREPLHLSGEQVYRLGPLDDAARLFLERAHQAAPSLALGEAEYPEVASLCQKLEGVPLAIELACARLSSMPLNQLLHRLDSVLTLASKDSTESPRHRTLRETIDWSYKLLSPSEKSALQALSVFRGTCTAGAIRGVANAIQNIDDAVDSLVDKSLVQLDDAYGEERYRLLDVVREYANEKLVTTNGAQEIARRHAAYYARLVSDARMPSPAGMSRLYAKLDADAPNIRVAIEWGVANDRAEAGRAILDLTQYWRVRGTLTEARSWISRVLDAGISDDRERAALLCAAASFATMQDDLSESLRLSNEALEICRNIDDGAGIAEALFRIAEVEHRKGHLDTTESLYRNAFQGFTASKDARGAMLCLGNLGMLARQRGALVEASELLDDATRRAEELSEERVAGEFTMAMAWVQLGLNDLAQSRMLFERAFAQRNQAQDKYGICCARHGLATVALKEGQIQEAYEAFRATLGAAMDLQLKDYIARALHGFAAIQAIGGKTELAARYLGLADRLFDESGRELRDSVAYDIAAQSIERAVPKPKRVALREEGALMSITDALAELQT